MRFYRNIQLTVLRGVANDICKSKSSTDPMMIRWVCWIKSNGRSLDLLSITVLGHALKYPWLPLALLRAAGAQLSVM
jgi:hypothetical protein